MKPLRTAFTVLLSILATIVATSAQAKPLKVFILAGQSNMEGHAQTMTFPAIAKDPATAGMYKAMVDADGKPVVCDDVHIAYSFGNFSGDPVGKKSGKLTAGYGSQHHVGTGKIGPEFTFGIYMHKILKEPVLLIKGAWGGKSLLVDFRPPSAGEIPDEKSREKAGIYYKLLIEHVKEVLADPKKVYPDYNAKDGFELAGFAWFQGFNDMVGPYPRAKTGKVKDFSEYSRLLSCFIRDVRKDLSAPNLPFVIGVMGVGGDTANEGTLAFRKGMAAPAETAEFKGNVANVHTAKYWPRELDDLLAKTQPFKKQLADKKKQLKKLNMKRQDLRKAEIKLNEEMRADLIKALTNDELFLLDNGMANRGFHYYGSAKCLGQIGKAFAETLIELKKDEKK
jgi:alpha-galactosidase